MPISILLRHLLPLLAVIFHPSQIRAVFLRTLCTLQPRPQGFAGSFLRGGPWGRGCARLRDQKLTEIRIPLRAPREFGATSDRDSSLRASEDSALRASDSISKMKPPIPYLGILCQIPLRILRFP